MKKKLSLFIALGWIMVGASYSWGQFNRVVEPRPGGGFRVVQQPANPAAIPPAQPQAPQAQPEAAQPEAAPSEAPANRLDDDVNTEELVLVAQDAARRRLAVGSKFDDINLDKFYIHEMPLKQVATVLMELTGENIVVSDGAKSIKVSLYLRKVNAREAIEALCRLNRLWYRTDDTLIRILTTKEYSKELVVRRDENTRVFPLKYASAQSVAELVAVMMGGRIQYASGGEVESYGHVGTDGSDPFANVGSRGRTSSMQMVESTVNKRRSSSQGSLAELTGDSGELSSEQIEAITNKMIEGGGELTAAEAAKKLGVQSQAIITVFMRNNSVLARSVDETLLDEIQSIIQMLDTPTRQVLLEVRVLDVSLGDEFESFFDVDIQNDADGGGYQSTVGMNFPSMLNESSLVYTFLNDSISMKLEFFQEHNRIRSIATPLLICANNAPAEFFIGEQYPVVVGYDPAIPPDVDENGNPIANTGSQPSPIVQLEDIGTKVRVIPSINQDGTVTLRFLFDISQVNKDSAKIPVINQDGAQVPMSVDTVSNKNIVTIVVCQDNQSVAMGGLIKEEYQDLDRRVPILGRIPMIGFFFSKKQNTKTKTETIILIEPHIVGEPTTGEVVTNATLESHSDHPYIRDGVPNLLDYSEVWEKLYNVDLPTPLEVFSEEGVKPIKRSVCREQPPKVKERRLRGMEQEQQPEETISEIVIPGQDEPKKDAEEEPSE